MEHDFIELVFLGSFLANLVTSLIWGYILLNIAIRRIEEKGNKER